MLLKVSPDVIPLSLTLFPVYPIKIKAGNISKIVLLPLHLARFPVLFVWLPNQEADMQVNLPV